MSDTAMVMVAYCSVVLAATAYFAANVGIENRGHRHKGWMALMGGFLGLAVTAVVLLVAS